MTDYIERGALERVLNIRLTRLRECNGNYDQYTDGFDEAVDRVEDFPAAIVFDADRLRELAEADKAGRVVVLPCKVGDTVYQLRPKTHAKGAGVSPRTVFSVRIRPWGSCELEHQGARNCQSKDLGKTWFLTREEAEKALEAMQNG